MIRPTLAARLHTFATRPVLDVELGALHTPLADAVSTLPDMARMAARIAWQRRVANERGSILVATRLRTAGAALELPGDLRGPLDEALVRLADDEERHAQLASCVCEALGVPLPAAAAHPPNTTDPVHTWGALLIDGLVVGEAVSAARYQHVRSATDLVPFPALLDVLWRDEVQHAMLGMRLLPVLRHLWPASDPIPAATWIQTRLKGAFAHVHHLLSRQTDGTPILPVHRAQPTPNPGVVEPGLDLHAFLECRDAGLGATLRGAGWWAGAST